MFPQLSGRTSSNNSATARLRSSYVKDTWTREFSCLPLRISNKTPSIEITKLLQNAGLGKKKIVFDQSDDHEAVCKKLIKVYPRLKDVGGFTLHRSLLGGFNRKLTMIDQNWFHIKNLRNKKSTGTGIIYIRPMQRDLNLSKAVSTEVFMIFIFHLCFLIVVYL